MLRPRHMSVFCSHFTYHLFITLDTPMGTHIISVRPL
jgi:hypothetical protein